MANKIQRGTSSNLLQDDKLKIETVSVELTEQKELNL